MLQRERLLTARGVPDLHRLIPACRRQPFSVRAKRHALDVAGVPFQRERRLIRVEHLNGLRLLFDRSGGVGLGLLLVSVRAVVTFLTAQQRECESYGDHDQAHISSRKQRSAANPTSKLTGGLLHCGTLSVFLDDEFNVRCCGLIAHVLANVASALLAFFVARFNADQNETQHGYGHSVSNEAAVSVSESQIEAEWLRWLLLKVIHRLHRGEHDAEVHQEHSEPEPIPKFLALRSSRVVIAGFVF